MKQKLKAVVCREDNLYVAQCLEVDVASQGKTEKDALKNLSEALELHFEEPVATRPLKPVTIEVDISAA